MAIYYLKLYFGDNFKYSFWRKGNGNASFTLTQAVQNLEDYAYNGKNPSDYIQCHLPRKTARDYTLNMFASNIIIYGETEDLRRINIEALETAHKLFPEDLWPLYWMGCVHKARKNYGEALKCFQELFENNLSYCIEILPLAYEMATSCAMETGQRQLAADYNTISKALSNEHDIDVSQIKEVGY